MVVGATFILSFLLISVVEGNLQYRSLPDQRPSYDKRTYHSSTIDSLIDQLKPLFLSEDVATIFSNCLPNTLDTTVSYVTPNPSSVDYQDLDSFVITGDIDAMWLRDSMNQVIPYIPYASQDTNLQYLLEGLINRHAKSILIDPFANSFNFNASGAGWQGDKRTPAMTAAVFEGKYEIDSLAALLKLSYWYWKNMNDETLLRFTDETWLNAVSTLLTTVYHMQNDNGQLPIPPYLFQRYTTTATDTQMMGGRGPPNAIIGLTRSLFRPSDDGVTFPLNIPGNAMICVEITHLTEILTKLTTLKPSDSVTALLTQANSISSTICGVLKTMIDEENKLPYEIDGNDGKYYMDDANVPSLLSLPNLGFISSKHVTYAKTRDFILSSKNPFYYSGRVANGIGGPHVGTNMTWPMSIVLRAMTSTDETEVKTCLDMLTTNTAGTGFMHESFNVNAANNWTREWFAWANGLFGELILQVIKSYPHLVLKDDANSITLAQSLVKTPISMQAQASPLFK